MVHSYYVIMGGFAIEQGGDEDKKSVLPDGVPRLTLGSPELEFIATCSLDRLPNISKEHIEDRSKANGITKAIVCGQALWFCIQCIARCAQGLSLSLLELNTFAHALCAFIMYYLWWEKPLDINEPTILKGDHLDEICACFFLPKPQAAKKDAHIKTQTSGMAKIEQIPGEDNVLHARRIQDALEHDGRLDQEDRNDENDAISLRQFHQSTVSGELTRPDSVQDQQKTAVEILCGKELGTLTKERDLYLYALAEKAPVPYQAAVELVKSFKGLKPHEQKLKPSAQNFPSLLGKDIYDKTTLSAYVAYIFAGLVYGGIHLLAWNAPFPTDHQLGLWRTSGVALGVSGLLWPFVAVVANGGTWKCLSHGTPATMICCFAPELLVIGISVGTILFPLFYVVARVFLVVECYINLVHLPESVFRTIAWAKYIPHIT